MDYTKPITKLKELINSNADYSLIDGLQILDNFFNELSEPDKQAFINWLESNFSFDNEKDYKAIHNNFEFYRTMNYYIEDKTFNYDTAVKWLESAKRGIVDNIHTIKEKEGIEKPLQLLNDKEKLEYLQKLKNQWFEKFNRVTGNMEYNSFLNPTDEKRSILNIIQKVKILKRSSILFRLCADDKDHILLPSQQFRQVVYPSLQAYHIFNWISEQILKLSKPKSTIKPKNTTAHLKNFINDSKKYEIVIENMILKKWIEVIEDQIIWKKNANESTLISYVKQLDIFGYIDKNLTENKKHLTNNDVERLIKNTFNVEVKQGYVRKFQPSDVYKPIEPYL